MKKIKKRHGKGPKLSAAELRIAVADLFKKNPDKKYSSGQIAAILNVSNSKDSISDAIAKTSKRSKRPDSSKRRTDKKSKSVIGHVDMTKTGSAYIVTSEESKDIFVPQKYLNTALHGDTVELAINGYSRGKPIGKVAKVLKRSKEDFIGPLRIYPNFAICLPFGIKSPGELKIPLDKIADAEDGNTVMVRVTKWPSKPSHDILAEVQNVIVGDDVVDLRMKTILVNNGINFIFPEEVLDEAKAIDTNFSMDVDSRRDFRDVPTLTIDPADAKDFDDALSIEIDENGQTEIGVHIADVTHFVQPLTALDKEAYLRANSVYLVDRVVPMLPEKLSNNLCSLRPNEDRLCFSAVFTFSPDEQVIKRWFGKTIIHSDRRFTYEEAQEVLENGTGELAEELMKLDSIAKQLRKKKFKKGAIAFETDEVRFRLDTEGRPESIYLKKRKDAHLLVEDFMLLANREVATYIGKHSPIIPFVYRVHNLPDPEKVADFAKFAAHFGFKVDYSSPQAISNSYNHLSETAQKNNKFGFLVPLAIRTMAKAIYTPDNMGHYALGFNYYGHFTSPIRRYADVLVHRILQNTLTNSAKMALTDLEVQCKYISQKERDAMDAERESVKFFQTYYLSDFIGQSFEGMIAGFIDRGVFVSLSKSQIEGMIGFETMNESYEFTSKFSAVGVKSGRTIKLGDRVMVKLLDVDLEKGQISLSIEAFISDNGED